MDGFIAPKKPYGFEAMLDDILDFAARTLVENGRLSFWMPTANDDLELVIPTHPLLEVVSVCIQPFNRCMLSPLFLLPSGYLFSFTSEIHLVCVYRVSTSFDVSQASRGRSICARAAPGKRRPERKVRR